MSELKSYDLVDIQDYRGEVYLKSEADKYIQELKDRIISMTHGIEYCLGYDIQSIVGQIANAIRKQHWRAEIELDNVKQSLEASRRIVDSANQVIANLRSEKKSSDERLYKKLRHYKYKRCLKMAECCRLEQERIELIENKDITDDDFNKLVKGFYKKWRKRWMELAEKFKEAK